MLAIMPRMVLPLHRYPRRQELAQALQALSEWPWRETLATLRVRFREDRLGLTASSLTFTTVIALVPLFTVTLAVFSAFPMFGQFQDTLQTYFLQSLVPPSIAKPVLAALTQFAAKAYRVGSVGVVLLLLSALALMLTIDRTLNGLWRVRKPRSLTQRVLVYWAVMTLGPLLLGVSLTITSYAVSASRGLVGGLPDGLSVTLDLFELLLLATGAAGLFHFVPNTHVRWRHAFAGGAFTAVGIEIAKRVVTWYLSKMSIYATIYGAFATLPLLLTWIYVAWVIVLLGAVVAAYAPSLQMRALASTDSAGQRFRLALAVLEALLASATARTRGLTGDELAAALRADPLRIEPVLGVLLAIDWVGRLDEPGGGRYVLLCDPLRTLVQPLVDRLLLDRTPAVERFWQRAQLDRILLADIVERPETAPRAG